MTLAITDAPADFDDWSALLALLHAAFAWQTDRIDPPSSLHRLDAAGLKAKANEEQLVLALDDGRAIGCLFARSQHDVMYVGKFAVSPDWQGRGVGRALMHHAERLARRKAHRLLELETRIELVENRRTFESMGFVKVGEHAHAGYDRPTSITMRKTLPD